MEFYAQSAVATIRYSIIYNVIENRVIQTKPYFGAKLESNELYGANCTKNARSLPLFLYQ